MEYVYLLRSARDEGFYIGKTGDLERRFAEHCRGGVESTASRRPLMLVYAEMYTDPEMAARRESSLKDFSSAYTALLKRLGYK
jgi:putative endonuclease